MELSELQTLVLCGLTTLGAFAGSGVGAYFRKKGENLATHEDITKLVEQVRAVTTTTKEIEGKISDDYWRRQKHWESKRGVVFEVVRKLRVADDALLRLQTAHRMPMERPGNWAPYIEEAAQEWRSAISGFSEASMLASVVCGEELTNACNELRILLNDTAIEVVRGLRQAYDNSAPRLGKLSGMVARAALKEFDFPNPSEVKCKAL